MERFSTRTTKRKISVSYHLFLDDDHSRIPHKLAWIDLPPVEWTIVRNYNDFVATISKRGMPTTVSFDHDLADEHYVEYTLAHDKSSPSFGTIRYERFKEKTGYHAAKWLANYCVDNNTPLPLYYIHTLNPIGRQNIFSAMESARGFIKSFTIPDVTPEEKAAFRQRMKERNDLI